MRSPVAIFICRLQFARGVFKRDSAQPAVWSWVSPKSLSGRINWALGFTRRASLLCAPLARRTKRRGQCLCEHDRRVCQISAWKRGASTITRHHGNRVCLRVGAAVAESTVLSCPQMGTCRSMLGRCRFIRVLRCGRPEDWPEKKAKGMN